MSRSAEAVSREAASDDALNVPVSPSSAWTDGNEFQLLENGEEYFPAVYKAIASAERQVFIETFILFEDDVGRELHKVIIAAARRGVQVHLTVDDFGSPDLSEEFVDALTKEGVLLHVYDPRPRILGYRTNMFRRLHRKIVSVDGRLALVGGINFGEDHLLSFGEKAKQDYAVQVTGPIAEEVHRFTQQQVTALDTHRRWWSTRWSDVNRHWPLRRRSIKQGEGKQGEGKQGEGKQGEGKALLVYRDNDNHRNDIERHYYTAIRNAKHEIVIANAYFFPGYGILRQLRHAARRGVSVKLLLQGNPDVPQAKVWATLLYPRLLAAGVEIYEYCQRPLHAKVAVIDNEWATVGSSNLDPLSLALNLEANVIIRDVKFAKELRDRLEPLLRDHCQKIDRRSIRRGSLWLMMSNFVAYHCTRHFPRWVGWLPAHLPRLHSVEPKPRLAHRH